MMYSWKVSGSVTRWFRPLASLSGITPIRSTHLKAELYINSGDCWFFTHVLSITTEIFFQNCQDKGTYSISYPDYEPLHLENLYDPCSPDNERWAPPFLLNSFCSQGPFHRPACFYFNFNIWQDAEIRTRVAATWQVCTASVQPMSYCTHPWSHPILKWRKHRTVMKGGEGGVVEVNLTLTRPKGSNLVVAALGQ